TPGTSITLTFSSAPSIGNALILSISNQTGTVSSVSGGGVTWSKAAQSNSILDAEVWIGLNSDGTSSTVTVNFSGSTNAVANCSEWSGLVTSSPVDLSANHSDSFVTGVASGSITTTAPDLVIAVAAVGGLGAFTTGPDNGFTPMSTPVPNNLQVAY